MNISKILVCLIGLTISSLSTQAQSQKQEVDQITTTLNYYLEGGTNNDYATLAKAFHPEAMMQSVGGNGHQNVNVLEFFKKGMKPGPRQNRTTRIVSVDVQGNAAQAKLTITYEGFRFIDYMTLLKVDGKWLIVSKVYYKEDL
jgi:protease I